MSFLHVLGSIGKDIGKVALGLTPLIPGPIGVAATAVSSVISQELSGVSGSEKKAAAVASTVAVTPTDHPNKVQIISSMVEAIVQFLNALAELFPNSSAVQTTVTSTEVKP